jgi:uncharacterized protein YbjT (DUF2867 family)
MDKKAIIIGATGATGKELVQVLLQNESYSSVIIFVRKSTSISHPKLQEYVINFDDLEGVKNLITGDVLFSCLGTTMALAKTKENQYKVDFTYQYNVAKIAAENGVKQYVLISSIGAYSSSMNFYLKMKGELDEAIKLLPFQKSAILRPGPIDAQGKRPDQRSMENSSINALRFVNKLGLFKKYQPITTSQLAKAMHLAFLEEYQGYKIYESLDIFHLLNKK